MIDGAASRGRICLVDDHAEFRESAAWWLESLGYEVAAFDGPVACLEALDGEGALRREACLLLDVRMPQMSGLQLMDALRARGVSRPVIFMTGHGDVPLAVEAMRKGALTFLEKPFREEALEEALAAAFSLHPPAPELNPALGPELQRRLERLTPREREIMDMIVKGDANKVVATKLGISHKTVELHRARLLAKMEVGSLMQLVRVLLSGDVVSA